MTTPPRPDLEAIEERVNDASVYPGPWSALDDYELVDADGDRLLSAWNTGEAYVIDDRVATFIAAASTDVPALVAEVRELEDLVLALWSEGWFEDHPVHGLGVGDGAMASINLGDANAALLRAILRDAGHSN